MLNWNYSLRKKGTFQDTLGLSFFLLVVLRDSLLIKFLFVGLMDFCRSRILDGMRHTSLCAERTSKLKFSARTIEAGSKFNTIPSPDGFVFSSINSKSGLSACRRIQNFHTSPIQKLVCLSRAPCNCVFG